MDFAKAVAKHKEMQNRERSMRALSLKEFLIGQMSRDSQAICHVIIHDESATMAVNMNAHLSVSGKRIVAALSMCMCPGRGQDRFVRRRLQRGN